MPLKIPPHPTRVATLPCKIIITKYGSLYDSKSMARRTQSMPIHNIHIPQASVATHLKRGEISNNSIIENILQSVRVKFFFKDQY